jgi:hypothetical protein
MVSLRKAFAVKWRENSTDTNVTTVVAALIEHRAEMFGRVTVKNVNQIDAQEFFLW